MTAVVLLATWVIFRSHLPWWAAALILSGATIISIESVVIARKASRDE